VRNDVAAHRRTGCANSTAIAEGSISVGVLGYPRNESGHHRSGDSLPAMVIRPPVTELTAANTDQVVVRVGNGTLLVFPSYLHHSVDVNASGDIRVSVSFNLMFSAFTTALSKPLWGEE
jgi:hypothetical protein